MHFVVLLPQYCCSLYPLGVRSVLQSWFFTRIPIPYSTGTPSTAHILMGIHSGTYYGPVVLMAATGTFSGTMTLILLQPASGGKASVNTCHLSAQPKEVKFFLQRPPGNGWTPWFEALTMNGPSITVAGGAGWLATALGGGVLFAPVQAVLRALLTLYIFAGCGIFGAAPQKPAVLFGRSCLASRFSEVSLPARLGDQEPPLLPVLCFPAAPGCGRLYHRAALGRG